MKYDQVQDGDTVIPVMRNYRMKCCDCCLIHVVNFKIVGKSIQFTARRDNRATAAARRKVKKPKMKPKILLAGVKQ